MIGTAGKSLWTIARTEGLGAAGATLLNGGKALLADIGNAVKGVFGGERVVVFNGTIKYNNETKILSQMESRGWTEYEIREALGTQGIPAVGKNGSATRYIHPRTGRSVVIDNKTGEVFHVGGDGFLYD